MTGLAAVLAVGVALGMSQGSAGLRAAGDPDRCATPRVSAAEEAAVEGALARAPRATGLVVIPTWVHVINRGPDPADGNVPESAIEAQIEVLNDAFSGATGGAATPFRFELAGITRTENRRWFKLPIGSKTERAAKEALRQGDRTTLNLYTSLIKGRITGYTYFPWQKANRPALDGVVVRFDTLPGGTLAPYHLGDTAVHEVGHWLGLYHTFQNGCRGEGDRVADTPAEKGPSFACAGRDTCASPGVDPIQNFLNYSPDACMWEFTPGQVQRMVAAWNTYRAGD